MINTSLIRRNLNLLSANTKAKTQMFANGVASVELVDYARNNRPWTDRTGAAKNKLHVVVSPYKTGVKMTLEHGVAYGVDLELSNEKKYAIVKPTITNMGDKIMNQWIEVVKL